MTVIDNSLETFAGWGHKFVEDVTGTITVKIPFTEIKESMDVPEYINGKGLAQLDEAISLLNGVYSITEWTVHTITTDHVDKTFFVVLGVHEFECDDPEPDYKDDGSDLDQETLRREGANL